MKQNRPDKKIIIDKKLFILLLSMTLATGAFAADLKKAETEGTVSFYANMTAIEPIIADFNGSHKINGIYTRISTSKYLPGNYLREYPQNFAEQFYPIH